MKATKYAVIAFTLITVMVPGAARADDTFMLTDGTNTMTWTLPSSPNPLSSLVLPGISFTIDGVTVLENGVPTTAKANITFFNFNPSALNDGGLSACNSSPFCSAPANLFNIFDFQVYSGTELNPTFTPGTYTEPTEDEAPGAENDGDTWALSTSADVNLTLTIVPPAVPEPSSLLLLGTGLLGLMGMGLYKKRLA